ncbi:MAG TPA: phenylalanine--tRNA ligase beta subunit-related protein [Ktedonobacterales bacterium]|nr:phenylalanine--tRNA ligase beta subunit-related protein [Ktedonobacterales bacterium]
MSKQITFDIGEVVPLFETFRVGVVVASSPAVRPERPPELERIVQAAEAEARATLGETPLAEIPELRGWREAYKGFGVKKTSYRSSVERLLKKVVQGEPLPHVNTLVDAYNAVSVRYRMPVGADDLDRVVSPLGFRFSRPGDTFIALGDESQADDPPYPGEVVYADAEKCLCRRWNWYQDARSAIRPETTHAALTVQAIEPTSAARVEEAVAYLEHVLAEHCGAQTISAVLDATYPTVELQTP